MGVSVKNKYTKEEREQQVIDKGNPTNSKLNKISDYLSQPNVKAFNSIIVDKAFKTNKKGRPQIFSSREECEEEVVGYFKLCYDYDMIPTVASLVLYLGINRDSFYEHINNPTSNFSDILQKALDTCHAYQEQPALEGRLVAPTYIFNAKNYFSMKDAQDVNILATNNQQNTSQSIDAIKEQISLENNQNLIDYNSNNK